MKKTLYMLPILLLIISCTKESIEINKVPVSEEQITENMERGEGNGITIGTQVWMNKNLSVSHYRNGDTILMVNSPTEWAKLKTGAWCYYSIQSAKGITYGKLYNWYAVRDPRGLAPVGWHMPSDSEWAVLKIFLGGEKAAGGRMKATSIWNAPNNGATNISGFTALPGGYRDATGAFKYVGYYGYWWSSTQLNSNFAWYHNLSYNYPFISRNYNYKTFGFSVRCVKN